MPNLLRQLRLVLWRVVVAIVLIGSAGLACADVASNLGAAVASAVGQGGTVDGNGDAAETSGDGSAAQDDTPVSERGIAVDSDDADDAQIKSRLQRIYSEIQALSSIEVAVSNSVVELSGTVESSEFSDEAEALATGIAGVVKVENALEVSRDVSRRVRSTWERIRTLSANLMMVLPLLLLALLVAVGFWYLADWIAARMTLWKRLTPNAFIATLLASTIKLVVVLMGILLALYLLDATSIITTVLGAAGIVGLAVGFAVRDTVENFIASILLSLRQPFQMNDFVQIDQYMGNVARLTGRATILISADGNQIRIPNSIVFKSIMTNYTRHPQRRFHLVVPVDEAENLARARTLASEAMSQVPGVMDSPKPSVQVESLGEAVNSLDVYGWVDQRSHDLLKVRSAAAMTLKHSFKQAGIVMPESVHTLRVIDSDKAAIDMARSTSGDEPNAEVARVDHDRASAPHSELTQNDKRLQDHASPSGSETPASDPVFAMDAELVMDTAVAQQDDSAVKAQLADEQADAENLLDGGKRE